MSNRSHNFLGRKRGDARCDGPAALYLLRRTVAEAIAIIREYEETARDLFYDEAERWLRRFAALTGHLPDDWIEVVELFPGVLTGIRLVKK
jgi:hypothetical protein